MNLKNKTIYIFKGNPNATYIKNDYNNSWSICNESTDGYVLLNDPDGTRKLILDNESIPATKYKFKDKDAIYLKNTEGDWFISNALTTGFIRLNDPTGERAKLLDSEAVPLEILKKSNSKVSISPNNNSKKVNSEIEEKEIDEVSNLFTTKNILIGIVVLIGLGCFVLFGTEKVQKNKFGCYSFEDCLSKYNFEGAYHYYGKYDGAKDPKGKYFNFKKLISAQVNFWCNQKEYEKAFSILNEHTMMSVYNLQTDDEKANDSYNEEAGFMNSQLEYMIDQMIVTNVDKGTIKKYAKAMKPIVIGDENNTSIFGGYDSYVLSDRPYETALKRIFRK